MNKEERLECNVLLSIINKCVRLIKVRHEEIIDICSLPMDDVKVYELMNTDRTCDVFGLEYPRVHSLIELKKPCRFCDIEELNVADPFETYVCFWLKLYYPDEYRDALNPFIS